MASIQNFFQESASRVIDTVLQNDGLRQMALHYAKRKLYQEQMIDRPDNECMPMKAREERFLTLRNMLYGVDRAIEQGRLAPSVRRGILKIFVGRVMLNENNANLEFQKKYGTFPPGFILVSPTSTCNLACIGCYANSIKAEAVHLRYEVFARILREKADLWGSFFNVISGGEPLLWRSEGKTILDVCREFKDQFFMMYTNGTLITKEVAEEMAELGNITPAISLEGFEKETDGRRGRGTFAKIVEAFGHLRKAGVPFGVSLTATRNNAELLLSPEFMDFCFKEQGAIYGWIFQYMPVGRHYTLDLLVTPEQRLEMQQRVQRYIREDKLFLADFWNSGPITLGCFAAGRSGGYLYIDWKGDIMPCAFFPYSTGNIHEVYRNGGNLNTVLSSPFFKELRQWQNDYGFMRPKEQTGNWIRPCPIRDHHRAAVEIIRKHQAQPADRTAAEALTDEKFHRGMADYDERFGRLSDGIWEHDYLERSSAESDVSETISDRAFPWTEGENDAGLRSRPDAGGQ